MTSNYRSVPDTTEAIVGSSSMHCRSETDITAVSKMDKCSAECDRVPVSGFTALCYSTYQARDCFTKRDYSTGWPLTTGIVHSLMMDDVLHIHIFILFPDLKLSHRNCFTSFYIYGFSCILCTK